MSIVSRGGKQDIRSKNYLEVFLLVCEVGDLPLNQAESRKIPIIEWG